MFWHPSKVIRYTCQYFLVVWKLTSISTHCFYRNVIVVFMPSCHWFFHFTTCAVHLLDLVSGCSDALPEPLPLSPQGPVRGDLGPGYCWEQQSSDRVMFPPSHNGHPCGGCPTETSRGLPRAQVSLLPASGFVAVPSGMST